MTNRETIVSALAFGVVSLFLLVDANLLFKQGDLNEISIDLEIEESVRELEEIDNDEIFLSSGDDLLIQAQKKVSVSVFDLSAPPNDVLQIFFQRTHLFILFCCLKITFC